MARITGLARSTIYHGLCDVRDNVVAAPGRIRKPGGGRKKKAFEDPTLLRDLKGLVAPTTRSDPMRAAPAAPAAQRLDYPAWCRHVARA